MKNNKLVTILLVVIVLITLIGAALFVFVTKFNQPQVAAEPPIDKLVEVSVDVPEVMTNLADKRVVKVALKIQTTSKAAANELTKRNFQINNIIIEELSEMTLEDLNGKQGKQMFKKAVKTKLNELMQEGEVVELYFTSFISS